MILGHQWSGAVSALSSKRACPTAFIALRPPCALPAPLGPLMFVLASSSLVGWGCELHNSTGLCVHPGHRSLLYQGVELLAPLGPLV